MAVRSVEEITNYLEQVRARRNEERKRLEETQDTVERIKIEGFIERLTGQIDGMMFVRDGDIERVAGYSYNPIKTGENIKRLRLEHGFTLQELGEFANKHFSTIGKYESGEVDIPPSVIATLANELMVAPMDILAFEAKFL